MHIQSDYEMEVVLPDVKHSIKHFNEAIREYSHRNDKKTANLLESLNKVSCSLEENWYTLDPGSREALDFFVNLYELMRTHDEKADVIWLIINILEEAIKQPHLKECLVHTFKFVPELTKLLKAKPVKELKVKILQLIQELTYGIKITWQEAHLPFLISSLTKWITGDEPALIPLSLGILVNLCYKNAPAVYVLMKSVDVKQFLKVVLKLLKSNAQCKVQVCKLLIILEDVSGGLPDAEMEIYVRSTCPTLTEAIQVSNPALMKHVINFFKDIVHNDTISEVISNYSNYAEDIEKLLNIVLEEENLNPACIAALFDYLCSVIDLQVFGLEALHLQMLHLASNWLTVESVSSDALNLMSKIIANLFSKKGVISSQLQQIMDDVCNFLGGKIPDIVSLLETAETTTGSFPGNTTLQRLTSLVLLLSQLVQIQVFSTAISDNIDPTAFRKLFDPLLQPTYKENDLFQKTLYSFYVEALSFITDLANKTTSWLLLYNDLLQESQVQMILAIALYTGCENIKKKVLAFIGTTGFSSDCLALLSGQMSKLNKLVSISSSNGLCSDHLNTTSSSTSSVSPLDLLPLLTVTQQGHLNNVLEKCEQAARKNENSLTTSIMELYHYRIAELEQSLRQANSSQEAADVRAAQLQAKLSQMGAEVGRLHQLLYSTTQSLEQVTKESSSLRSQLNTLRMEAQEMQNNYSQCLQNLRSKTVIISNLNKEVDEMKATISSLEESKKVEIAELKSELSLSKDNVAALKKTISNLESSLDTLSKESDSKSKKIDSQNKEIVEQSTVIKKLKALSSEKESQIVELSKELSDLKRMQEIISELATGKRKI